MNSKKQGSYMSLAYFEDLLAIPQPDWETISALDERAREFLLASCEFLGFFAGLIPGARLAVKRQVREVVDAYTQDAQDEVDATFTKGMKESNPEAVESQIETILAYARSEFGQRDCPVDKREEIRRLARQLVQYTSRILALNYQLETQQECPLSTDNPLIWGDLWFNN